MLPEVIILLNKNNISLYYTFTLILVSVTFLNITDILYDHHRESNFDIKNTLELENQNNSIKNISDKKDDAKCVTNDKNEIVDLELSRFDNKNDNNRCKNNFFFGMCKSNTLFIVLSLFIHSFIEGNTTKKNYAFLRWVKILTINICVTRKNPVFFIIKEI